MKNIWIIGAGRFGKKAVSAMKRHHPHAVVTVMDHSPQACSAIDDPAVTTICTDGVSYLYHHLENGADPDWIIPVIPVHLAFEWMRLRLLSEYRLEPVEIPEAVKRSLPNVHSGKSGEIFVSVASFVCPENCPEPSDICTYTRKPRTLILHQRLQSLSCPPFVNVALQSQQLAPGIGGLRPQSLWDGLAAVLAARFPVLLSTACKCHGVVQAFRIIPSSAGSASAMNLTG